MTVNLDLNKREQEIYTFIKHKINNSGYPPSIREIGRAVGLKSSSTVHTYLLQLEQKGLLRRDPTTPRAIVLCNDENQIENMNNTIPLPVIGNVAAGLPILAEQNIEDYIPVPIQFIGDGNHFILKVQGESMIEAGIMNQDYLIVRQQQHADNGEIAVVLLEDEATVKRFYQKENHIELRPENSSMEPIIVEEAYVVGKVVGLFRKI